ncbi:uncharacterized protein LOC112270059 [Brachypodium distachyon]|uniref:Uncharacterized protein n=1 Tax=Brachypodium distachyon TaxID=15368 RepID=I1GPY2_BRADI|nr:uncharacterized protein LOC112270059 [Brachypodium distachyon]PNT74380.1 hypothetical protein BRADI_1g13541v3 [Brachypodium distachyon]|eukprot:XP_024313484.1 uncharacterized protein LOC112270059 [Brachypodium distachyon]
MEAGAGGGNCAGVVAVAAVSAAVTLATVRLYHGLESDFRRKIQLQLQHRHSGQPRCVRPATAAKKKVRFAEYDVVLEPCSNNEEHRSLRRQRPTAGAAGGGQSHLHAHAQFSF